MGKLVDFIKKHWYYRQHPETALRYLPIVDLLSQNGWQDSEIVEIGSGSYGITPYLKKPVVGVDTSFDEPQYPLLKQVRQSGSKLPFTDQEFAVAILSDVLEHVEDKLREQIIQEAIRVSRQAVIISGPFGSAAFAQDQHLAKYSQETTGNMHPFFKDHLKFGLPEENDVLQLGSTRLKSVQVVGRFLNLSVRELLMKIFISNHPWQYYFYLKGVMPLIPLLRLCNWSPCYRTVILLRLK